MLWLLIGVLVFLLVWMALFSFMHKKCGANAPYGYCYGHPGVMAAGIFAGLIVWFGLASWWATKIPESEKWTVTYNNLAALNDGSSVNGTFFLGGGTIDSDPSYMFYTENGGDYKLRQVYADDAVVRFSKETPKIEYHNPRSQFWTYWNMNNTYYVFKVPEGSIKYSYSLDAK